MINLKKIAIYDNINDKLGKIKCFHENAELLENIENYSFIQIEEIPTFEDIPFKDKELYINLETEEIFAEYRDRPVTQEEFNQQLMQQIIDLQIKVELLGGV